MTQLQQLVTRPLGKSRSGLDGQVTVNEQKQQLTILPKVGAAKTTDDIIAQMRQEEEESKRNRILERMSPAFREKLEFFDNWLRREVSRTLRSRYELGLQVLEMNEDQKKNQGKLYGTNAIGRICKILKWDDGVIRSALRFVQRYSPTELDRLCEQVLPNGEPLTWSHVRVLIEVDDLSERKALLERTISEGWTCSTLARAFKDLGNGRPDETRGRPPKVPKNFDDAVAGQQQFTAQWARLHDRVWSVPERSLLAHAAKIAPEEVTTERLRRARELARGLRRVAEQAMEQAGKADEVVRDLERLLDRWESNTTPAEEATICQDPA